MKLKAILKGIANLQDEKYSGIEIRSIENDSRKVDNESLFIAASGYVEDAHPYINSAYNNGCRFLS